MGQLPQQQAQMCFVLLTLRDVDGCADEPDCMAGHVPQWLDMKIEPLRRSAIVSHVDLAILRTARDERLLLERDNGVPAVRPLRMSSSVRPMMSSAVRPTMEWLIDV